MPLLNRIHSHAVSYCDIRLDDNVVVFRGTPAEAAGVALKGTLAFRVKESISARSIALSLVGTRKLQASISGGSVRSESAVFTKKWEFLEFSHRNPVTLGPGDYEYGFETALPGDLPESIEGLRDAQILYRLKAVIDRPLFAQNITAKKHLRIVRTLGPGALELSQSMSVASTWLNKVEYSISTPSKAVVFGSSIPIDVKLVPLLKGLTVGKIVCNFKELHSFSNPENGNTRNNTRHILQQTFENCGVDVEGDEDFGGWRLQESVKLPRALIRCVQDCEVECIRVRHKLKLVVQLRNPDGHSSELRASLPVQLFISPDLLMGEDNIIHRTASSRNPPHPSQAPPRYDEHYLDRLYQGLPQDLYETPTHTPLPSDPNSPNLSRQGSSEGLDPYSASHSGRSTSSTPPRTPSRRRTGSTGVPLASSASPSRVMAEVAARLSRPDSEDYFSRLPESGGHAAHDNGPRTSAHFPGGLRGDELAPDTLSRVPSYSTAVRSGTRNLSSTSSLPTYHEGFRSAPDSLVGSPMNSPVDSSLTPAMRSDRDGSDEQRSRRVHRRHHTSGATDSSGGGHSFVAEAERRLRRFQFGSR
ncbi:hypothetical protein C7212DRAFT_355822 [Tuber magnatum]|uniref:Arrestin C-terminal-like domain-containing protein n=1 Tax=Tuber magnatum TaxID=42249 RepID=A0A317T281_9PEZI|nr:hypothetical protein C7212DRAFT_355822 [Tuber magnatum]